MAGLENVQMNKLPYSDAKAIIRSSGDIYLIPENLTHLGAAVAEMPQINYRMYNGIKYRYFYAITRRESDYLLGLVSTW